MSKKEIFKRYILFVISLFFSGLGVALTKHAGLGVSPISSIPNVVSIKYTALSMGSWLIVFNCILILGQILILKKSFKAVDFLQIPLSFLFGYFTDFGMKLAAIVPVNNYAFRILCDLLGIAVLGFGISLSVIADVIMNAGEAFVRAVSLSLKKSFANTKIVFDISCVSISIILSLIFFDFKIEGAREGTVLAAFLTGLCVKWFTKRLSSVINGQLKK